MMGLLPATGIFVATAPTDLRKAVDGLAAFNRTQAGRPCHLTPPSAYPRTGIGSRSSW
jgi:hypothetical protein